MVNRRVSECSMIKTEHPDVPWLDPNHLTNRAKIPKEVLDQYRGQHVAYSWDGTRILAGAEELEGLYDKLKAMGQDTHHVVYSYVDAL
jgi:hypothetical protein